ncbi:MAG: hypothetical protein ACE15E_22210 [Acidobacteriota bacterium]
MGLALKTPPGLRRATFRRPYDIRRGVRPFRPRSRAFPVTGYQLPVAGSRLLPVTGCRVAGYRLPVAGYRLPVTSYQLPVTGYRLPVAGLSPKEF